MVEYYVLVLLIILLEYGIQNQVNVYTLFKKDSILLLFRLNWPQDEAIISCDIKGNQIAAVGFSEGSIAIINIESKHVLKTLTQKSENDSESSIQCVAFCPSINWLATGSLDFTIIIWDLNTFSPRHILRHLEGITQLLWIPNSSVYYYLFSIYSVQVLIIQ